MSYAELMGFKKNFGFYDGPQGMPCNLTIITLPGATVTITLGAETHTATADADGRASFTIGNAGLWSVVSVKDDVTQVGTVQVENVVTKALALPAPLESLTWSEISAISRAGLAAQNFAIGDTKKIRLSNGEEIIAMIIGFDHDDIDDGSILTYGRTKAGITFRTKYTMNASKRMGASWAKWANIEMRNTTLPTILGTIPQDCASKIVNVKKYTANANSTTAGAWAIETTTDNLFLLSLAELRGDSSTPHPGEGEQYEFFKTNTPIIYDSQGGVHTQWTRSPNSSTNQNIYITAAGTPTADAVTALRYAPFAFCI